MSQHALQALLAAAAQDSELKTKLTSPETFEAAVAEVLSISSEEEAQLKQTLGNEDTMTPTEETIDQRQTPGPGTGGRLA